MLGFHQRHHDRYKLVTTTYSITDSLSLPLITHKLGTEPVIAFSSTAFPHPQLHFPPPRRTPYFSASSSISHPLTMFLGLTRHKHIDHGDGWIVANSRTIVSETERKKALDSLDSLAQHYKRAGAMNNERQLPFPGSSGPDGTRDVWHLTLY